MTRMHDFKEWHRQQIDEYSKNEFPIFELYAEVLEGVLKRVCSEHAKLGIVQSRPKAVSSFAEKAVRKWPSVDRPIEQLTDLCGARVITHTQGEIEPICGFIETHFDIEEAEDVGTRLGATEFGYGSFHYIVRLRPEALEGVSLPKEFGTAEEILDKIGDRKAEIQVRTLMQHSWADVMHDRLYKTKVKTPDTWTHLAARQAAILETADNEFSRILEELDQYLAHYSAYMTPAQMKEEIETLETIFENEPVESKKPAIALKIAKLAGASGDWETVVDNLGPLAEKIGEPKGAFERAVLVEFGRALCQTQQSKARDYLERVTAPDPSERGDSSIRKLRAEALALLAASHAGETDKEAKVRDLLSHANLCDPNDPYHLIAAVEQEVLWEHDLRPVRLAKLGLTKAIATCTTHATLGIELPRAFYAIAKANLLLKRYHEAAEAYARAAHFSAGAGEIEREHRTVRLLQSKLDQAAPDELDWMGQFLSLIRIGKLWNLVEAASDDVGSLESAAGQARHALDDLHQDQLASDEQVEEAREELRNADTALARAREAAEIAAATARAASEGENVSALGGRGLDSFELPVVLLAGATDASQQARMESYRQALMRAFEGFRGTVISGGTTAGIPGLVGELSESESSLTAIGYLPAQLPAMVSLDNRYAELRRTTGVTFSPLEPVQYWVDLLALGVKPPDVCLLGIGGASISSFEYNLALAMGATVGVVESSGGAATEIVSQRKWWPPGRLLALPEDVAALRAFVHRAEPTLSDEQVDAAARAAHEVYAREHGRQQVDAALQPWEYLRRDFQESNRDQIIYAAKIIERAGYRVGPLKPDTEDPVFKDDEIEMMAELEHGRWVVERLRAGWTYGDEKDADNKITPYLVPWSQMPESIKDYDREAVRGYPRTLRKAGLGIFEESS